MLLIGRWYKMLTLRRNIRNRILRLPKEKRLELFDMACLTDIQYDIMQRKFIKRESIVKISLELDLSVEAVDKNIAKSYDTIIGVLDNVGADY